jgi:hypothetical protein
MTSSEGYDSFGASDGAVEEDTTFHQTCNGVIEGFDFNLGIKQDSDVAHMFYYRNK